MNIYVIEATVTNAEGESVTIHVSDRYAPITPEWKKTYRPIAIELALAHIPVTSNGTRVKWIETRV